ncbi:MAG: hypothetical protein Q8Q32_02130 [bacterium]|nr:hypothetical protein [bacterium]
MKTRSSYSKGISALIVILLVLAVWHLLETSLAFPSSEVAQEEPEAEETQELIDEAESKDSGLEGLNSLDLETELEGLSEIERF